jgi:putative hemolysin
MYFFESIWFDLIFIPALILWSGFYAAAEIAVISVRKSKVQELIEREIKNAKLVGELQNNTDDFFAIVQIGMTVLPSLASALSGIIAVKHLKPIIELINLSWIQYYSETIAVIIIVSVISYMTLIIGELVPKSLGLKFAESLALSSAAFIKLQLKLLHPIIKFLSASTNLCLKMFKQKSEDIESHISEDEFKLMLEEGTRTGVIDKTEHELIKSIFEFTDTTAGEVMIPRTDVVALNVEDTNEKLIKTVLEEGYSRMPVYSGTIDNIIGVVYAKDLISLLENRNLIVIQDIIRQAFFVPDSKKISQIMRDFQSKKNQIAIVVGEFGGFEGIVTMEYILEEIVGEIHDEYDEITSQYEVTSGGALLIKAMMSVSDFNAKFASYRIPEDEDYETIGGFVNKYAGRLPEVNEKIKYENLQFTVLKKVNRRLSLIKVEKMNKDSADQNVY